ncbi:MAG TPA: 3'-5' exonuclease [Holophaga sp.]|nr:3'-5' exonuclease [Holophaga sp.]HPS67229.1 3'-5' exonuclease [Holophaga sp.]
MNSPEPLKRPYLFLDTETGGLGLEHSLLTLGLVVGDDGEVRDSLEILVAHDPYVVSAGGMAVNRIDLVRHHQAALAPEAALGTLEAFCARHFPGGIPITLVGHNVAFDRNFLAVFHAKLGRPLEPRYSHRIIDTHSIAAALRDAGRLPLDDLGSTHLFRHFGIAIPEEKRHTALGDALGTFQLYWKLVELIGPDPAGAQR